MSDSRDHRTRNVDPFDAPDDYADPWRGRKLPIFAVAVAVLIALLVVGFYLG